MPELRIEGLTVASYGRVLVRGLDLDVPEGGLLGVTGGSGSGKTTLLEVLQGVRRPDVGRVLLGGAPIDRAAVGAATQQHELLGGLTAAENVASRVLAAGPIRAGDWSAITELLAALGLPESSWHNLVEQLSGGQQQRVAVARALVGAPPLVCLDDPTSELDEASAGLVRDVVRATAARGSVVVVAVPDDGASFEFDRVVALGHEQPATAPRRAVAVATRARR